MGDLPPVYSSWSDYLARTTRPERMKRCYQAAKRANRAHGCQWPRKLPRNRVLAAAVTELVRGPCGWCGALPQQGCAIEPPRVSGLDVWALIEEAKGRCAYCHSLAVESRPSHPQTGAPLKWEHIGRRIGSLDHAEPFLDGRVNSPENLRWACLWCNTWPGERRPFAADHGGFYPSDAGAPESR